MKQDMILILDLGSEENPRLAILSMLKGTITCETTRIVVL